MLAADKLQLQSALKQQATALKEKEFSLHHNNLMTVGTQAAVLAGLDITLFVEFHPPDDAAFSSLTVARCLKFVYYSTIVAAFCANVVVVSHTTALSVLGGSLALRGPDGSMMTATDALFQERQSVFSVFGIGLSCTLASVLIGVWILLPSESALPCCTIALFACHTMWRNYRRVSSVLAYDQDQTVDLRDLFEGVARMQSLPPQPRKSSSSRLNGPPAAAPPAPSNVGGRWGRLSLSRASPDQLPDRDSGSDDDDYVDEEYQDDRYRDSRRQSRQRTPLMLSNGGGATTVKRRAGGSGAGSGEGSPSSSSNPKSLQSILTV